MEIIYTANFNNYDTIKDQKILKNKNAYYVSNYTPKLNNWKLIPAFCLKPPVKCARYYKINPHKGDLPKHDISIWVDASITLKPRFFELLDLFKKSNAQVMFPTHPQRNCTYKEAEACKTLKKDFPDIIDKQMKYYKEQGLKENSGMIASGVMFRRNTEEFNDLWWNQVEKYSHRDQLSVIYAAQQTNTNIKKIPINIYKNPYFKIEKHA